MSTPLSSRKRKRGLSDVNQSDSLSIELSSLPDTQTGPVLASFPYLTIPINTPFSVSVREEDEGKEFVNCSSTIAGETDAVEFSGSANDGSDGAGSRYFLALHRPGSSKLVLQPTPVYLISRQVKALKNFRPTEPDSSEQFQARSMLGKVFGTKKAKAAIDAQERNRIDVSAMEDVAGVLQDRIDEGTENLPTQEKMQDSANAARLIPTYNADAERPEDIYPLHNIIPEPEWAALDSLLSKLKNRQMTAQERACYPMLHLMLAYSSPKPKRKIVFVPVLYRIPREKCPGKDCIIGASVPAPEVVVDSLLARFTETPRGSTKCVGIVDDYATDTTLIAADLKMSPARVNDLFKSLGCTIGKLTSQDLKRLGLPESVGQEKRAILKAPLTFPKPKLRRRA
ncbi:RNA polymerase I associated factor, A49-like protein [Russula vinacea]|nr:RNA polymerase I associated factor, A49-like protein [Russula vinacea]